MRIALLISGRASRYEVALLKILENTDYHNIDLFMSINDKNEDCKYYQKMKISLKKWLKSCYINEFKIDNNFYDEFDRNIANNTSPCQLLNNKYVPLYTLSMYWNWNNAFNMAKKYADSNDFEYDCYMIFRSDIINCKIPKNIPIDDNNTVYYARPICHYPINKKQQIGYEGLYGKLVMCDAWAWGSRKAMSIYCDTYDFAINKYKKLKGSYTIANEPCLTDNIFSNNVNHKINHWPQFEYHLDLNRRIFDNPSIDTKQPLSRFCKKKLQFVDITSIEDTKHIRAIPQE